METELKERAETELKEREMSLRLFVPNLVQVNGEGRESAIAGQMTSIELSVPSIAISSLPSPLIDQLSCQLTDPNSQHEECSITSTLPGMATVSYTPILRGAHQLKITVGDTDIPGSPFTVRVLQASLEMRGVPINTITGVCPWNVAVSKSGEVVVSEFRLCNISVFSREGYKIRTFESEGLGSDSLVYNSHGVAITTDNRILLTDSTNNKVQMFTMEGKFLISVGEKGIGPLQFSYPIGIAVNPSGLVYIAERENHRIQVLHPDLSPSHMFGSHGSGPGQFDHPRDIACAGSGIVYVTEYYNHRVQLFSADGQFISSFGSQGSQPGQLDHPRGICIDSTDTVYVTDNYRVSAFTTSGKFLKCFGDSGSGEGELNVPGGIAVDNTTGNIYVCDTNNSRVVVY